MGNLLAALTETLASSVPVPGQSPVAPSAHPSCCSNCRLTLSLIRPSWFEMSPCKRQKRGSTKEPPSRSTRQSQKVRSCSSGFPAGAFAFLKTCYKPTPLVPLIDFWTACNITEPFITTVSLSEDIRRNGGSVCCPTTCQELKAWCLHRRLWIITEVSRNDGPFRS